MYKFNPCFCRAFSGKYVKNKEEGVYTCVVCGNQLFSSDTKYDSKSGWPSFYDVVDKEKVRITEDTSHGKYGESFVLFIKLMIYHMMVLHLPSPPVGMPGV